MITLKQLPTSVKLFVERCDAFIVGSAADPNAILSSPQPFENAHRVNDIDVIIPFHEWDIACTIIQSSIAEDKENAHDQGHPAMLNTYGGMKFVESIPAGSGWQPIMIDVWPSDLNKYLLSSLVEYVWNPKFNLRYVRCENGRARVLPNEQGDSK